MKKILVMVLIGIVLTGCSSPVQPASAEPAALTPTPTPESEPLPTEVYGNIDITRVAEGSFGVYGALQVDNYVAGATIDENIKGCEPLYIINRINKVSERKSITTYVNETVADIPIRRLLHDEDVTSVLKITSDLGDTEETKGLSETLKAEKYNGDGTIAISGFVPNAKRLSTITYVPDSEYNVSCSSKGETDKGYTQAPPEVVSWVTFDQTSIIIPPDTYAPIWIKMTVPEDTKLPDKWQFWIEVRLSSGVQLGSVSSEIVYKIGYKVNMR